MGSVSSGGTYHQGATVTLTATPNSGYRFVRWNDNNTQNPRTVTVNADVTYTAYFEAIPQYTVTIINHDPLWGSATGDGIYYEGDTATLLATPNSGYRFGAWYCYGYYFENPHSLIVNLIVNSNVTIYVTFSSIPQYTITVSSHSTTMGSVSGGGTYSEGDTATLTATANNGYQFSYWVEGNNFHNQITQNPLTVTVTANATYKAYFNAAPRYTITVYSNNTSMGTVSGGGNYYQGTTATLTATPNSGYRFVRWDDNNTENPRTVTVTANKTYTAYFEAIPTTQYTITVNSNNSAWGTVSGGGNYSSGATATLRATPNNGYRFVRWQDNNTQNPRTVTVTANKTYTAYFEATSTPGTGEVDENCIITSFPYIMDVDNEILCWQTYDYNQDGRTWGISSVAGYNGTKCFAIQYGVYADDWLISPSIATPGDYTVRWLAKAYDAGYPETYQVLAVGTEATPLFSETLSSTDFVERTASFNVTPGDTIKIYFRYVSNDMCTFLIDNIVISRNTTSISNADYDDIVVTALGSMLNVEGADGESVTVTDIMGRTVHHSTAGTTLRVELPASGVYLVRVGNRPARKVIAMQ